MSNITLITPPDKLHSTELTFLLIHPSNVIKEQFQNLVAKHDNPCHVYLYEGKHDDIEWLLDVFYQADIVILDIDNSPTKIRDLTGYFISKDKTFWLTNGGENYYNVISRNRIFDLDYLDAIIGGKLEAK